MSRSSCASSYTCPFLSLIPCMENFHLCTSILLFFPTVSFLSDFQNSKKAGIVNNYPSENYQHGVDQSLVSSIIRLAPPTNLCGSLTVTKSMSNIIFPCRTKTPWKPCNTHCCGKVCVWENGLER